MSRVSLVRQCKNIPVLELCFAALYLAVALIGMMDYVEWHSANFIVGLTALPLMFMQSGKNKFTFRFLWLGLFFTLCGIFIPVKTAIYLVFCCGLLFLYEHKNGGVSLLPLITLLLMAPVCQNFAKIFSFPIRLWLTQLAGSILQYLGLTTTVTGNLISLGDGDFAVDPACMGLNMLITSLLCGLIMIAIYQRKESKILGVAWIMMALGMIVLCNIIANLLRILLLVYFVILPGNVMHDACGIFCLALYVILPASFILKWLVSKKGKIVISGASQRNCNRGRSFSLYSLIFISLVVICCRVAYKMEKTINKELPRMDGYTITRFGPEVLKIENSNALIYAKPLHGFIYTEHNPLICWTGSGYAFDSVAENTIASIPVFTGILSKGKEKLYTAWWYDNGISTTNSQWIWRWKMLKGMPEFSIINITAISAEALAVEVKKFSANKALLFHNIPSAPAKLTVTKQFR